MLEGIKLAVLGLLIGFFISVTINVVHELQVINISLNNITVAVQEQNKIIGYVSEGEIINEKV